MKKVKLMMPFLIIPMLAGCGTNDAWTLPFSKAVFDANICDYNMVNRGELQTATIYDLPEGEDTIFIGNITPHVAFKKQDNSGYLKNMVTGNVIATYTKEQMDRISFYEASNDCDWLEVTEAEGSTFISKTCYDDYGNVLFSTTDSVVNDYGIVIESDWASSVIDETFYTVRYLNSKTNKVETKTYRYEGTSLIETKLSIDLSYLGLPEYEVKEIYNDFYTFDFYKNDKLINTLSFTLSELQYAALIPFCDGIYFQRSEVVTESDYDFYDVSSNEYYRYTPYFYNLKKNKIIELDKKDFPYLMIYTDILVDANREHLDSHIAEYWDLSVSKDISNENVGLCHFSKDLVVTKLPNGFDPTEICKIGTGYINVDDRILYDENMAYVDTLGVNVVAVCGNYAVFKNSINYYGVIDQNGTIVYNPVFHNFYDYYSNDQVMYFTSNSYDNFAIDAKTGKAIADESYEGSNYVVKFVDGTVKYANKEFYKLDNKDDDFFIWSQGSLHISRFDLREFVIFAHLREDGAITFVTTDVKYFEY